MSCHCYLASYTFPTSQSVRKTEKIKLYYKYKVGGCTSDDVEGSSYRVHSLLHLWKPRHNQQILDTACRQNPQFPCCLYNCSWGRKTAISSDSALGINSKNNIIYFEILPQNCPSPSSLIFLCLFYWLEPWTLEGKKINYTNKYAGPEQTLLQRAFL